MSLYGQFTVVEFTHQQEVDRGYWTETKTPTHSYGPCTDDEANALVVRHKEELVKRRESGENISLSWVILPLEAVEN